MRCDLLERQNTTVVDGGEWSRCEPPEEGWNHASPSSSQSLGTIGVQESADRYGRLEAGARAKLWSEGNSIVPSVPDVKAFSGNGGGTTTASVGGMIAAGAVMDEAGCDGISATSDIHRRVYEKENRVGRIEPEKKIGNCFI